MWLFSTIYIKVFVTNKFRQNQISSLHLPLQFIVWHFYLKKNPLQSLLECWTASKFINNLYRKETTHHVGCAGWVILSDPCILNCIPSFQWQMKLPSWSAAPSIFYHLSGTELTVTEKSALIKLFKTGILQVAEYDFQTRHLSIERCLYSVMYSDTALLWQNTVLQAARKDFSKPIWKQGLIYEIPNVCVCLY